MTRSNKALSSFYRNIFILLVIVHNVIASTGTSSYLYSQNRYPLAANVNLPLSPNHRQLHFRGGGTNNPNSNNQSTRSFSSTLSVTERLICGGISRASAQILLYPVDALRTLAQTRDHRTLSDLGLSTLIRGCATTSSFALFIGAIQFGLFASTKQACGPLLSSAIGAAGSCLVSVPQEVIKQRLVTGVYSSFRNAVSEIWKNEGLRGFYSAWRPTMLRNVPFVVITFTSNDLLQQRVLKLHHDRKDGGDKESSLSNELSIKENLVIGISSALIAATLTHPADVVKTRLMTQAASKAVPYKSTMDCVGTMWKTEGIKAFYSGFVQRSIYMGPLWSIQFALNGYLCKSLEEKKKQSSDK